YRPLEVGLDHRHSLLKVRGHDALQLLEFSLLEQVRLPHAGCVAIQKGDAVAALMIRLSPLEGLREPGLRYRYEDVIAQQSSALQEFAGKIVLVGLQKQGEDKFFVRGGEERFGIELHADVVNNLISGINVRPMGGGGEFALTAAMAAFGATLRVWRPHPALRWRLVLIAAVIAMYLALVVYVCQEFHVLLNTVYHVGAFVLAYWTVGRLARRWAA
ncbi:MAG: CHASE2 domain-containing protein, partial [Burkholderiales bacterium]